MADQLASEFLKLRTTRTFWGFVVSAMFLVGLFTVLTLAIDPLPDTEALVRTLLSTAGGAGLLAIVLGAVSAAGEYRHGTISSTFLVTPKRTRVSAAQLGAGFVAGVAIGLAAAILTAAIVLPWIAIADGEYFLSANQILGVFAGGILYCGLATMLGVALGMLLRNQIAAVLIPILFLLLVDPILTALIDGYGAYALTGLQVAITGGSGADVEGGEILSFAAATAIWIGYTAILTVAAVWRARARDID